ncbi:MAG: hypothetical protein A3C93_00110 [Candidatus Lloydbacteria bacterium RIFCSPHIGHO2_02_FULL_54_17]|uniref:VWFA domain-containing protein n=1 Tax=Candidatus Lloydbacteria bacterium RIFCSPHIGHO2_02_FULL_54_17 TaxID=1798664 RepID=A0A1G2DI23_9BACT|nr:MAG: hypothetical protein A2762_03860 [Candidatus Lloydbacteria bacterium RIFCSPHIGHO2_01_FULL_54_11]OGZ13307.1 MAG: hypothetical protein A3C93_00110 [Candidatus Lloydbacteria bacterium RIFCSPHIGHO2_02_FULL_54_17]OGZ17115.1 MAG: hypothetical protein A3H76_02910 [Candidatus Lloydbacteria bacterium RIFCSPLOWO2_02_FULL_54_12]
MTLPYLGTFDVLYPWNLLWVIPGVLLLLFHRGGFVRFGSGMGPSRLHFLTRLRSLAPSLLLFVAWVALGFGLADLGGGYTKVTTEESVSRIVVTQDQSGSMYTSVVPMLQCVLKGDLEMVARYSAFDLSGEVPPSTGDKTTDRELRKAWSKNLSIAALPERPRIEGSCAALETLLDDLKERAARPEGSVHHEVAFLRFADTSILQEPFTTDYGHLRDFLSEHNWSAPEHLRSIGSGTSLHFALYDMFLVALRRHIDAEPGVTAIPPEVSNELLGRALANSRDSGEVDSLVAQYPELFRKLGLELADTSLVVITDATDGSSRWVQSPSVEKMLKLAGVFHIPVYIISTEQDDAELRAAVESTGTKERPGGYFVTNKLEGYASMKDDMKTILDRAFVRKQERVAVERRSHAAWCFGAALALLCLAFFLKEGPLGRSLTG